MGCEQRAIIQFLPKERVHPTQIHRRLAAQYGLGTYSIRSVPHWCQLFDCGRQNLHDVPRSGRLPTDHLYAEHIACMDREPFALADSLAETMDVSPAAVLSRLHNSPGMKIFHLRWDPHRLVDGLRQVRVAKCGELLRTLEVMQRTIFTTLSQVMRAGFTSNTSAHHNGGSLAMKCLKGWTRISASLCLCSRLFGAPTASTC
jgi:hypothetical protein